MSATPSTAPTGPEQVFIEATRNWLVTLLEDEEFKTASGVESRVMELLGLEWAGGSRYDMGCDCCASSFYTLIKEDEYS